MHILRIWLSFSSFLNEVISMSCGIDNSPVKHIYEGVARMETYPWLGILYYPYRKKIITTAVVLVTRQIALGTALEIDQLPKEDFRARARVVVGHNCSGPRISIRDYTYHPDYSRDTFSTIAMIQLETDHVKTVLRPICPPPPTLDYENQKFYAMILSNDCKRSKVRLYKMRYVAPEQCKAFYRRTGLDIDTMWPSHTACARSVKGGRCVWRSGAILVVKWGLRWRLLGFGVYGPGCQAPARFLDYGMYHKWVQRSVERVGRPAITNMAQNYVVLRRTLSNVQRFGPCDQEELNRELFVDSTVMTTGARGGTVRYNLTIIGNMEYTCVILKADYENHIVSEKPRLRLRRWCSSPGPVPKVCSGFQFIEIQFYVEIAFRHKINYRVMAYGKNPKIISPDFAHKYANKHLEYPIPLSYMVYKSDMEPFVKDPDYPLYGKKEMISRLYSNSTNSTTPKP